MNNDNENRKRGVQSVDVGARILGALTAADSALSLTAIGKASGVSMSSCHRYLSSFIKAGFIVQDPVSSRYDLGPGIIEAGLAALRRADPVVRGLQTCERLARLTGRTAQLAIWSTDGPVIVSWRMGRIPVPTNLAVGSRLPIVSSATGRAFLAYLPRAKWQQLVQREGKSMERAEQLASATRVRGFAQVKGSVIAGLSAAAAAVLDARGEAVAVVALLGLDRQLQGTDIEHLVGEVRAASAELGAAPDHVL